MPFASCPKCTVGVVGRKADGTLWCLNAMCDWTRGAL